MLLLLFSEQHSGKPWQLRHLPFPYFTPRKMTWSIKELAVNLTGMVMDIATERHPETIGGRRGELQCVSRRTREWQGTQY